MTQRIHTPFPKTDFRFPHFAPIFGAMTMPYVSSDEMSGVPGMGAADPTNANGPIPVPMSPAVPTTNTEPLPEVALGLVTSGMSGAVTGGIAAGTWRGAFIGMGVNMGAWSLMTLLGSWRDMGEKGRYALGGSAVLSAVLAAGMVFSRREEQDS